MAPIRIKTPDGITPLDPDLRISKSDYKERAREKVATYLTGEKIECLICGKFFRALGNHVYMVHGITAREYKVKFNIPVGVGLIGDNYRALKVAQGKDNFHLVNEKGMDPRVKVNAKGEVTKTKAEFIKDKWQEYERIIDKSISDHVSIYSINHRSAELFDFVAKYGDDNLKEKLIQAQSNSAKQNPASTVECSNCNKAFIKNNCHTKRNKKNYCSRKCMGEGKQKNITKNCVVCKELFTLPGWIAKRTATCSKPCRTILKSNSAKRRKTKIK